MDHHACNKTTEHRSRRRRCRQHSISLSHCMKFEQLLKVQHLFLLFCRCCCCLVYIREWVCVYALFNVWVCRHLRSFPSFLRQTALYTHAVLMLVSSFFRFFSFSPFCHLHIVSHLSLYPILTLSFFYSLLISSPVLHIFPNSMPHICIFYIRIVKYTLCAHSHHIASHRMAYYYYFIYCTFNHVFICRLISSFYFVFILAEIVIFVYFQYFWCWNEPLTGWLLTIRCITI